MPTPVPSEEISSLPNSVIDYLHTVEGREVSKEVRIAITDSCRDADYIPKVKNAGELIKDAKLGTYQVMHNGLKVTVDGYYGAWVTDSIKSLNGHHEPQEEKVFYEVSKRFDPNTWMIELGSYWSYYSLWFHQVTPGAKNICCEPDPENIKIGKKNAKLNNFTDMYFVDAAAGLPDGQIISFDAEHVDELVEVPIRTVDSLVKEYNIDKLQVLHIDVQGFELDSLKGAEEAIKSGVVRFVFISTHHYLISRNPNIHQDCLDFISAHGGHVICEHDIHESYSGDGLIVASFDARDEDLQVEVSRNRMANNQFRAYTKDLQLTFEAYETTLGRLVAQKNKARRLEGENKALRADNIQMNRTIEHLNNLPIPLATKEFAKSIKRSLKFRTTRMIWGKAHFYQPTEGLLRAQKLGVKTKKDAEALVGEIATSDAINAESLIATPSRLRVVAFELMREASHVPRKVARKVKGCR